MKIAAPFTLLFALLLASCAATGGTDGPVPGKLLANGLTSLGHAEDVTLAHAQAHVNRQQNDLALDALAVIVKREPENGLALFFRGYCAHGAGMVEAALADHLAASKLVGEPQKSTALYNAACACSLLGRPDEAFGHLTAAFEAGFNQRQYLETDTDLDGIRSDPRFAELTKKYLGAN